MAHIRWPAQMNRIQTRRDRTIWLRPLAPADTNGLVAFLMRLSADTRYLRYFTPLPAFDSISASREAARMLTNAANGQLVALAFDTSLPQPAVVGVAELASSTQQPATAEAALVVEDAYQREGIGGALCAGLAGAAVQRGISYIQAELLAENLAMRRLLKRLGAYQPLTTADGVNVVRVALG